MNILITGATGFVGGHLCSHLIDHGHAVRVLVRDRQRLTDALIDTTEVIEISGLDDDEVIANACIGIDTVVHLAARVHRMSDNEAQRADYDRINCQASLNLARLAEAAGVRRFVFLSSIKVNGGERDSAYSAADTPHPEDAYARSKYCAEQGLLKLSAGGGLEVVIVRPPLVYGKGVKANFLQLIRWIKRGVPLPLAGLDNQRSLVSVANLVDLLRICMRHPGVSGQVLLVSDGEAVSTAEIIKRIARAYGVKSRLFYCPEWLLRWAAKLLGRTASTQRLLGSLSLDISETQRRLAWTPPFTMAETLAEMACSDKSVVLSNKRSSETE